MLRRTSGLSKILHQQYPKVLLWKTSGESDLTWSDATSGRTGRSTCSAQGARYLDLHLYRCWAKDKISCCIYTRCYPSALLIHSVPPTTVALVMPSGNPHSMGKICISSQCVQQKQKYTVFRKKHPLWFLPITSANVDQFSKFFHLQTQQGLGSALTIKNPISP